MSAKWLGLLILVTQLSGCASWFDSFRQGPEKHSGSVVSYLYGSNAAPAAMP